MIKINLRHPIGPRQLSAHRHRHHSISISMMMSQILDAYTDPRFWMLHHHRYNQLFFDELSIEIKSRTHSVGMSCLGLRNKGCSLSILYLVLREGVEKHKLKIDPTLIDLTDELKFKTSLAKLEK